MLTKFRWVGGLLALCVGLTMSLPAAFAQSETEIQARRQLEFSKTEIAAGSFERALSSASAAFRLDPTLYDALVYKALAYEGLGELRLAEGLLTTYMDIRGELDPLPEAKDALARVGVKLGGSGESEASPPAEEGDPPVPPGGGDGGDASGGEPKAPDSDSGEASPEGEGEQSTDESGTGEATAGSGDDSGEGADPEGTAEEEGSDGAADGDSNGKTGPAAGAGGSSSSSGSSKSSLAVLLPSDAMLALLHLRHQRGILATRSQVGGGLTGAGLGLAAVGGILMGVSANQYAALAEAEEPTDQAAAIYAASMGMLGSGGALAAVGLPILIKSQSDLKALGRLERSLAVRPAPRLELLAQGLRLRF